MRAAFVLLGRIGDMVLTTPIFSAFKVKYPNAYLCVICSRANYQIIENNPFIDEIIIYSKSPLALLKTFLKLKFKCFDYWLDPKDHKSSESQLLAKISRAKVKIGFNPAGKKIFDVSISSSEDNKDFHFTERIFKAAESLGIIPNSLKPELYESESSRIFAENLFKGISLPVVFINLSAVNQDRIMSKEKWVEILEVIDFKRAAAILSYTDREEAAARFLINKYPEIIDLNKTSLSNIISIISRCRLVISPDTSIVHIASAFAVRTLVLYNDLRENFAKFHPLSGNAIVIMEAGIKELEKLSTSKIKEAALTELKNLLD